MKTTNIVTILATVVGLTGTISTASAQQNKQETKFCAALTSVEQDLAKLDALGPNSTVQELKTVTNDLRTHARTLEKDARRMKSPTAKQFTQSANQLATDTRNIPKNLTIEQARSRIGDDIQNVKQSAQQLASESGCPTASRERKLESGDATGSVPGQRPPG